MKIFVGLAVFVHILIVSLVDSTCDVVHPFLIVQIPAYGFFNSFFKLQAGLPAQFTLQLGGINGVAQVVSGAVGYVSNEVHVLTLGPTEQTVNGTDDYFDDVNVFPFVESADVVGFSRTALMENEVDGTGVVFNVEPVAHVFAFTVYG